MAVSLSVSVCLYKICQLGWRSQGVARWTANSKNKKPSVGEKVNWAEVACSVQPLFLEDWEGPAERKEKEDSSPLGGIVFDSLMGVECCCRDERHQNRLEKPCCFPLCHPSLPISHSIFLLPHAPVAFVEERRQTRTKPWTQMLVNTFNFFPFLSFL